METASKRLRRRRRKFSSGILHPKVVTWEWLHSLRTIHSKILLHWQTSMVHVRIMLIQDEKPHQRILAINQSLESPTNAAAINHSRPCGGHRATQPTTQRQLQPHNCQLQPDQWKDLSDQTLTATELEAATWIRGYYPTSGWYWIKGVRVLLIKRHHL